MGEEVGRHYDRKRDVPLSESDRSMARVRVHNNWVKSMLIEEIGSGSMSAKKEKEEKEGWALDLGCGHGGDLQKWKYAQGLQRLLAVDLSERSLESCRRRHQEDLRRRKDCTFGVSTALLDFTQPSWSTQVRWTSGKEEEEKESLSDALTEHGFRFIACHFAMHYACRDQNALDAFLQGIDDALGTDRHARFVHVSPDHDVIWKRMMAAGRRGEFGNSLYRISFDPNAVWPERLGSRYTFTLLDAIDECPEWLVPPQAFEECCRKHNLAVLASWPMDELHGQHGRWREVVEHARSLKKKEKDPKKSRAPRQWDGLLETFLKQRDLEPFLLPEESEVIELYRVQVIGRPRQ